MNAVRQPEKRREDRLDDLYEVVDELKLIAESDAGYAEYAENFLESLQEAGYDV
ncbi:hypothetical protein VB779_08835 [Haloarculaceae archaeon H-GB11]|nr:hypothetical protein [Haloarculaceae archaeon H-GB11]